MSSPQQFVVLRIVALVGLLTLIAYSDACAQSPQINSTFGSDHSGVAFTQNLGQVADLAGTLRPEVLFTTSFGGVDIFVAAGRISYVYRKVMEDAGSSTEVYRMDMELIGANSHPTVVQSDQIPGYNNYYLAHCPEGVLSVGTYRIIMLKDIYPKIDMVLRGNDRGMKCDFVVHPGGRPSDIQMRYLGNTTAPHLIGHGELRVESPLGFIQEEAPYSYQTMFPMVDGVSDAANTPRSSVASQWVIGNDGVVGFRVGAYDPTRPLVIDPVRKWATYYGSTEDESVRGSHSVEVDRSGAVYFTGATKGATFPVTIGSTKIGDFDMVIVNLRADGTRKWATMFGGNLGELAHAIAADSKGNVFIAGHTASTNIPVLNAHQKNLGGLLDGVIAKFDSNGLRVWATYYGGTQSDDATGIAVDSSGNPAVTGATASMNSIAAGAPFDASFNLGTYDAFLAQFSSAGVLQWGTYIGGTGKDCGWAVAYDRYDNVTVSGWTASANFPNLNPFQSTRRGAYDIFVTQFTRLGKLRWSTYYGGTTNDASDYRVDELSGFLGIATDSSANVIIAGGTESSDFPVSNSSIQPIYGGGVRDGFIVKFDSGGRRLWATYQGGGGDEVIRGVATDNRGSIVVVGITYNSNYPRVTPDAFGSTFSGNSDVFLVQLNAAGTLLEYGTYYGGAGYEDGTAISVGPDRSIAIAGETTSATFPVTPGAFQGTIRRGRDAFVVYFCDIEPAILDTSGPTTFCPGDSVVLSVRPDYNRYIWSDGSTTKSITVTTSGVYYVDVVNISGCSIRSDSVVVVVGLQPSIMTSRSVNLCPGDSVELDAGVGYDSYEWIDATGNVLGLGQKLTVKDSGDYSVRVTKDNCSAQSPPARVRNVGLPTPRITVFSGDTVICTGGRVTLDAGNYRNYRWVPAGVNDTNRRLTVVDSGLYQVMVTDSNGCTGLSPGVRVRFVDSMNPKVSGLGVVCLNSTTNYSVPNLGGSVYTWTLTGGIGRITAGQGSASITVNWTSIGPGSLTVQQTSTVTKCSGTSAPFPVDVRVTLSPTITPQGSTELCYGDSLILRAPPGYFTYTWSDDIRTAIGSDDSLVVRAAGRYTVAVDLGPCKGEASIVITQKPRIGPTISGVRPLCQGDTLVLQAEPPGFARYLWSTGDTTRTIRVAGSGNYSLRVGDADGCTELTPVVTVILRPLPIVAITTVGDDLTATAGVAYQWYLDGKSIPAATAQNWRARSNGAYSVRVTDSNGCSATSAAVTVLAGTSATITIRDHQGAPGEHLSIPIELVNGLNLDRNGIKRYTARIRFNRTILLPVQNYPSSYIGDDQIMTVSGTIPATSTTNGPLTTLEFTATLGKVAQTPITIEAFTFVEDTAITATTINGTFSLTGLCSNGGTRLVNSSGATALRPVRPNPVVDWAEVEYEIVEDGMTRLYLVDVLGGVTPVVHTSLTAGRYVARFDVTGLVPGVYVCVLETGTQRMGVVMGVVR